MSDDLEEKLSNIHNQLKKEKISLLETEKLFREVLRISTGAERNKAVEFEELDICLTVIDIVFKFADDWQAGKINPPTDEELNFLELIMESIPEMIDKLAKNNLLINRGNNFFTETNQNRKKIREFIKQEKSRHEQQGQHRRQTNSLSSNKNNEFNWLYVIIPGAILLVIMGIVIAYLLDKKSKEKH